MSEFATAAKIYSLQGSAIKKVDWRGKKIATGIFKEPLVGKVEVGVQGLGADQQADKKHHGGPYMAVYSYAWEHFAFWQASYTKIKLTPGIFGENITTQGLDEAEICIGDLYAFGEVHLQAVQPRYPCFKLGIRIGNQSIIPEFIAAKRTGIYWRVERPGIFAANEPIQCIKRNPKRVLISKIFSMMSVDKPRSEDIDELLNVDVIDPRWQSKLLEMKNTVS